MKKLFFAFLLFYTFNSYSQYRFSGYVNLNEKDSTIYLSIIDDYRKIEGIYPEQIISKTYANKDGFFTFEGDLLENENKIYRIHRDICNTEKKHITRFNTICNTNESLVFIAKNSDTLHLPFSFGNEAFCKIESSNTKSNVFLKIDSLKMEMQFAYSEIISDANRKLNNKKWFKKIQDFGELLDEPLAELYIYNYLSNRSGSFHNHYLNDITKNSYYKELSNRLNIKYPNSTYASQYTKELHTDLHFSNNYKTTNNSYLTYILIGSLFISMVINIFLILKIKNNALKNKNQLQSKLSKQEQTVLNLILENKSNKEIAQTLCVSLSTIKTHINNIYKKLGVSSRQEVKSMNFK